MSAAETFLRVMITGLGLGSLYALVAMGFAIIYKGTGVLNFAQGQVALLGAFAVVILAPYVPMGISLAIILVFAVVLGYLLERFVFRYFIGEPLISVIIVTLALMAIFRGAVSMSASAYEPYPEAFLIEGTIQFPVVGGIRTTFVMGSILALVTVVGLTLFFRYTVIGAGMQAAASDQQAAQALGISIKRTTALSWVIGILIGFVGGILFGISRGGAAMQIEMVGIVILAAVVIGGLDSIKGAFVGSLIVGVLEQIGITYLETYLGPGIGTIIPLFILLFVLMIRPYGLWGTERIERL